MSIDTELEAFNAGIRVTSGLSGGAQRRQLHVVRQLLRNLVPVTARPSGPFARSARS